MKQGIIISAILHLLIISSVLFSAPFSIKKKPFDLSQVIKINAVAAPQSFADVPAPIEDIVIPDLIPDDESFDIPIDDPTSVDEPVAIDKPKSEKPKPKKDKKQTRKPPLTTQTPPNDNKNEPGKEVETKHTSKGSPFAGASVDNESFDYPYWFTQAFNKISRNFRRTVSLDGNVICVVYFEVIRSGRVVKTEIIQSSGIAGVDRDCLAAIERSKPFPPLPPEFRDEIIGITIPINY